MIIKKSDFKKTPEEVQEFLKFRSRGFLVPNKKGKGSYRRKERCPNEKY